MAAIVTQEEAEEAPPPTFTARLVIKGWTKAAEEGDVNKGLEQLAFEVSKGRALLDDLCVEGLKAIDGPCEVEETAPKRVALRKPRPPRAAKAVWRTPEPEPEPEPEPASSNSKLVLNPSALLDSDDDDEGVPEPEPASGAQGGSTTAASDDATADAAGAATADLDSDGSSDDDDQPDSSSDGTGRDERDSPTPALTLQDRIDDSLEVCTYRMPRRTTLSVCLCVCVSVS